MRVEARGEAQGQEYCAALAACAESCPEGYGTYRYDEHGNTNDYSCTILPCCDPAYELPCNDADYYDKVSKDYEQCGCPCSDPEYFKAICACLSGIVACVLDPIFKLLACLGIYTPVGVKDEEQVRQFIAWAKSSDSKDLEFIATEAAKDPAQWGAEFNKLPLTAQRHVLRCVYILDRKAGYISVQKHLAKEPFEDGSDHMFHLIEDGLLDRVFAHPGWEMVILELESWLEKDADERVVRNPLSPDERVRRFCDLWKPTQGEARPTPEFCTWRECYMTLPDLAKDCARRAYQKFNPNPLIPALRELPNKEDVAAYNQYLGVAVILDSLIIQQEREPQVMLALNFWRGPVNYEET
jgi:hypothetical protein